MLLLLRGGWLLMWLVECCLLVLLDREVAAGGVTEPWEELYARRIVEQFAG